MPDIAMCKGGSCVRKHECGRFLAKPNDGKAFQHFRPFAGEKGADDCAGYWPLQFFQKPLAAPALVAVDHVEARHA